MQTSTKLALAAVAGLTACCPTPVTRTVVVDTGCQWATPITVSKGDTKETKVQALAQYDTWAKRCKK